MFRVEEIAGWIFRKVLDDHVPFTEFQSGFDRIGQTTGKGLLIFVILGFTDDQAIDHCLDVVDLIAI